MEGPFYPRPEQRDARTGAWRDNDLTVVPGATVLAQGTRLFISGQVRSRDDRPLTDAHVEVWQACTSGRYLSSRDRRRGREHDAGFQYWGGCQVDAEGRYSFKTILPPSYPAGFIPGWIRPPHIHVRVARPGEADFITQLYFDDSYDPENETKHLELHRKDLIIRRLPANLRDMVIRPVELAPARPESSPRLTALGDSASIDAAESLLERTWGPARMLDFPIVLDQQLYLD
jgi:protocatechuate 3,4-dioxygenase beta subunit